MTRRQKQKYILYTYLVRGEIWYWVKGKFRHRSSIVCILYMPNKILKICNLSLIKYLILLKFKIMLKIKYILYFDRSLISNIKT